MVNQLNQLLQTIDNHTGAFILLAITGIIVLLAIFDGIRSFLRKG